MVDPIPPSQIRVIFDTIAGFAGFVENVGQAFSTWSLIIYRDDNDDLQAVRVSDNAYFKFHSHYRYRVPPTQNRISVLVPTIDRPTVAQCVPVLEAYIRDNISAWENSQYWDFRVDAIPIPIDYTLYQQLWNRPRVYSFTP